MAQPSGDAAHDPNAPLVSFLIPVHNRVDLTQQCLASLFRHADPGLRVEFLIIDDCSTDETPRYLASLEDPVRVLRNEKRQCFGHNMNAAARHARGKYLCLLNNDTYHTPGWLRSLVETLEGDPSIGVVGNKHLFPQSGKLNHAGMVFDDNDTPIHLYPGLDADYAPANLCREFQILTAACWLVPRELFLDLGGFDENYRNGFEDVDFCLRVRQRGHKVYYCGTSVIYHYGQSSPGRTDNDAANEAYFRRKWHGQIRPDLQIYLAQDAALNAGPQAPSAKKAAQPAADVHFAIPLSMGNAFTWVTSQLAQSLEDIGVRVSLKPGKIDGSVGAAAQQRLQTMMQRAPSPRVQIKWNHFWDPYLNEELAGDVNAEVFVTNYRYGPQPLTDIDHWMRHVVLNRHRKLPVSAFCRDVLTELGVPPERCVVVPHGYSPEIPVTDGANNRYRRHGAVLLAITNSHDPYRYGTDVLLKAYAKAFRATDPVVLLLKDYGATGGGRSLVTDWIQRQRHGPRIEHLCEFVEKAELIKLYRGSDAFIAPFRGEGFGMKILDAFAVGIPVLCPSYGGPTEYLQSGTYYPLKHSEVPVGECFDRHSAIVPSCARWAEVDEDDLAAQLQAVVRDRAEAVRRAKLGQEFVLQNYSWERVAQGLRDTLDRFVSERNQVVDSRRLRQPSGKKLTVIMPTYNRPDALERCLAAYQRQTLPQKHWDLLVVDDASSYDVRGLVQRFVPRLPMRLEIAPKNAGQGQARNLGLQSATGETIVFTGDDIIPDANFLAEHLHAHDTHRDAKVGVLGYTYWHPEIEVTPLMQYMTGEGGQQFCYDILTPNHFAPFSCFYTSNVSVKRSLLIEQEELFSTRFGTYGFEDIELGLRMARKGLKLWYHPRARAGHYHHIPDRQALDRQYKVGRMLVVYALLHPQAMTEEHKVFLRWLDVVQHVLLQQPDFSRTCADLAQHAQSLQNWLEHLSTSVQTLHANVVPDKLASVPGKVLLEKESRQWSKLNKQLFAYHFDLMQRSGMADEWMGVGRDQPNPVRDFIRLHLSTGVWKLVSLGTPESPMPEVVQSQTAHRMLRLARHLRHHPWLAPLWSRVARIPGIRTVKRATKRMLHAMS